MNKTGWCGVLAILAMGLGGCGPTARERAQLQYFPKSYQRQVSADRYTVCPPDVLTIRAPMAPEVNNLKQQVSPDGTLNLDLLQRVYVAGLSPQEIEELLTEKLRTYYHDVKVHVDVETKSQFFYIYGETARSGPRPYTGRDTLLQALADAQPTRLAWPERIYVIRPSPDPDRRHVTVVNLLDMIERGDTAPNVLLAQDDIVYVPLNPLASVGVAIQSLLFPVTPVLSTAGAARYAGGAGGF